MKALGLIGTAVLFVFLGTVATTYAQQEKRGGAAGPAKQEQQAKSERQQSQARPNQAQPQARSNQPQQAPVRQAKQEQQAQPQRQQPQAQAKSNQSQQQPVRQAKQQQQATPQRQPSQTRSNQAQQAPVRQARQDQQAQPRQQGGVQRTAAAQQRQRAEPALRLSARGGGRIPDARFRTSFGRGHEFRIGSPRLVGGYSRFQYDGYWFGFVEPWPVDWYYTDDVYVDYIDGGYFLFNPYYPGSRISINVVL